MSPAPKLAFEGQIIDERFQIIGTLAEGGFGAVYLAKQLGFDREVAVKFLHQHLRDDTEAVARFEREAKALSSLSHKNLVACYAYGNWLDILPYAVFELVSGKTLRQRLLVERRIPWQDVFAIGIDVCSALSKAHKAGIVHRDLKPENIMISTDGTVKVLDFGLAHIDGQQLTQTGALVGSLQYMSPEQAAGTMAVPESDIYSLGCILYEAIAGQPPLSCDNPMGLSYKHQAENPPPLSECVKDIPESVGNVLAGAMAKSCKDRYPDAETFAQELTRVLAGQSSAYKASLSASTVRILPTFRQLCVTRTKIVAAIATLIIVAGVFTIFLSGNALAKLLMYTATLDRRSSHRSQYLENCGDLVSRCHFNGCAQLLYAEAADDRTEAIGRIRRLDKSIKMLGSGGQRTQRDAVVAQSLAAVNALPIDLSISEEDANLLVSALETDAGAVTESLKDLKKFDFWQTASYLESLFLQKSRLVQWISVTNLRQGFIGSDFLQHAASAILRVITLEDQKRGDLVNLFVDRQNSLIDHDRTLLSGRLQDYYRELLARLRRDRDAPDRTAAPALVRVLPWISALGKSDRQRLVTLICTEPVVTGHWTELAAFDPMLVRDDKSSGNNADEQSAIFIRACSLYKSGQPDLAFDSCCQLIRHKQAQGKHNQAPEALVNLSIALATDIIRSAEYAIPEANEKLSHLLELLRARRDGQGYLATVETFKENEYLDHCLEIYDKQFHLLQAENKFKSAVDVLRKIAEILSSTVDIRLFYYYSDLESCLAKAGMPAEASFERRVIPWLLSRSKSERTAIVTGICASNAVKDRWSDIAALQPVVSKDLSSSHDAAYGQSVLFIQACSFYASGKFDEAFDSCCQLAQTASGPLLGNCISLSVTAINHDKYSNSVESEKFARMLDVLARRKEMLKPCPEIDAIINGLIGQNKCPLAIPLLRKIISGLTIDPPRTFALFYYCSVLELCLHRANLPAEESIERLVVPWISRLSRRDRISVVTSICATNVYGDRWHDIAALQPLVPAKMQLDDDNAYRQSVLFIKACSMFEAGEVEQAVESCHQLLGNTAGSLRLNCIRLSVAAIRSAKFPSNSASEKLARLERLLETGKEQTPNVQRWCEIIKTLRLRQCH